MFARLIEYAAVAHQQHELPISKEEFLVGRGSDCDMRLDHAGVSEHHCIIRIHGDQATVEDLGSRNGTFVNNQRVSGKVPLRSGDLIKVVDFGLTFEMTGYNAPNSSGTPLETDSAIAHTVPVPPDLLEWARQTFDTQEFLGGVREIEATGGKPLESFIAEVEAVVRGS